MRVLLLMALVGCGNKVEVEPGDTEVTYVSETADPCAIWTWQTAGQPFVATWCTPCHASALRGANRAGAPVGVDLDTYEDTLRLLERVEVRSLNETMPPTGGPSADDLELLRRWLECGARP